MDSSERIIMGSNDGTITFGGVTVRENEIKKRGLHVDAQSGNKKLVIEFKNGIKVAYAASKGGILFSSGSSYNGNKYTMTHAVGIQGLEIKGTPGKDSISVDDCTISEINVLGNGADLVQVKDSKACYGSGSFISDYSQGLVRADKQKDEVILKSSKSIFVQNE